MSEFVSFTTLEKKLAAKETRKLRNSFRKAIRNSVKVTSGGPTSKATARNRFKDGRLDRLTFEAPYYIYIQHHGFEGKKDNGVMMRLKATNVLNKAVFDTDVLESLADGLSLIRSEEVVARFNFQIK